MPWQGPKHRKARTPSKSPAARAKRGRQIAAAEQMRAKAKMNRARRAAKATPAPASTVSAQHADWIAQSDRRHAKLVDVANQVGGVSERDAKLPRLDGREFRIRLAADGGQRGSGEVFVHRENGATYRWARADEQAHALVPTSFGWKRLVDVNQKIVRVAATATTPKPRAPKAAKPEPAPDPTLAEAEQVALDLEGQGHGLEVIGEMLAKQYGAKVAKALGYAPRLAFSGGGFVPPPKGPKGKGPRPAGGKGPRTPRRGKGRAPSKGPARAQTPPKRARKGPGGSPSAPARRSAVLGHPGAKSGHRAPAGGRRRARRGRR